MKRTISENKALKLLKVDSFRNVKKDQIVELAAMLDKMEPEVAKKAVEQFPDLAKSVLDLMKSNKEVAEKALISNDDSMKVCYDHYTTIMHVAERMCEQDDLTFEERYRLMLLMKDIADMKKEKDSENKKFNFAITSTIVTGAVALGCILVNGLGGNIKIHNPFLDD